MRRISITEALNELKLYDAKIRKAIATATFCGASKKSSDKVGIVNKDDFHNRAKASYQSVTDLIANRNALKSAIVKSNAETLITVNEKIMTRAEGIERKNSIDYEEELLTEMKRQYTVATTTVDKENKKVDAQIDKLLETFTGRESDKKLDKEAMSTIADPYRDKNEFVFIDPLSIFDKIQSLEADIDGFKANIDSILTMSNAVTFIEVDF